MRELLLGSGHRREKLIYFNDCGEFHNLTTVDIDPTSGADVIHDLNVTPWPFPSESFDEIHAYEVMEHLGQQGDFRHFFSIWGEVYRLLSPGGVFCGTSPSLDSPWLWGDPGHTQVVSVEKLAFLSQERYASQVGKTAMADYRWLWKGDLRVKYHSTSEETKTLYYVLEAIKQ